MGRTMVGRRGWRMSSPHHVSAAGMLWALREVAKNVARRTQKREIRRKRTIGFAQMMRGS
jgi:hypothetical protein